MLWFEREVVGALIDSQEQPVRSAVESFVDGSLRDMPEHLRLGVVGESVLLGAYVGGLRRAGRLPAGDREGLLALLERWEASPIGPLQAYVRLIKSLVILAENELAPQGDVSERSERTIETVPLSLRSSDPISGTRRGH